MIIDGHAHIYPERTADKVVRSFSAFHRLEPNSFLGKGTASDLISSMETSGADYTVIANFGTAKTADHINRFTLDICRENSCLIPLVSVYPGMPVSLLKEYFRLGAKGAKMHNGIQGFDPCDPGLDGVYRYLSDEHIPLTMHCGETSRVHLNGYTDMPRIMEAVLAHPDIPFVLCHLAAGEPDDLLSAAAACDNAVFDTSITFSGEHCIHRIHNDIWEDDREAVRLFREVGVERITFGSDYPFGNPAGDIRRIRSLDLTEREKELILGENTKKLYFR